MIPCFIINYNRLHLPRKIVEYLTPDTGVFPVILDNASTYEPLLEWYRTNPCPVEMRGMNRGNFVLWRWPYVQEKYEDNTKDGYIVTDPDLDLSGVPKDFLSVMYRGLELNPDAIKVGLSLEINDLPEGGMKTEILDWERSNWENPTGNGYFRAAVDTTFALYRYNLLTPNEQHDFSKNIRTNRPYTAKHMPWYYNKENLPEDERYYLESIDGFNHYSKILKELTK